jgi:hypothetical protein
MKSIKIECAPVPTLADGGWPAVGVVEMKHNEPAGHAEMLEGTPDQISDKVCGILAGRGLF